MVGEPIELRGPALLVCPNCSREVDAWTFDLVEGVGSCVECGYVRPHARSPSPASFLLAGTPWRIRWQRDGEGWSFEARCRAQLGRFLLLWGIFTLVLVVASATRGTSPLPTVGAETAMVGALIAIYAALCTRRLTISKGRFIQSALLRTRSVAIEDVVRIDVVEESDAEGGRAFVLRVDEASGRSVRVWFDESQDGPTRLSGALKAAVFVSVAGNQAAPGATPEPRREPSLY